jgi:hypothetical protein
MDRSKATIRLTLDQVKAFLAQEAPPKITEADTKANFIEPIIAALGWTGIGSVTREYYVKNSQEFIDYVMRGPSGLLLAIEAKALQADLTDKAAAQLIQYCSVEGIEWAALTNGRELQFFNTFLKPDLAAKRILSLDLLAFNSDEEFDALYQQIAQLSRENMTTPTGVRSWLNQRRMDATLRGILFNPSSSVTRQLRKTLDQAEVRATPQEIVQWFRSHLGAPITVIPRTGGQRTTPLRVEVPRNGSDTGDEQEATKPSSADGTRPFDPSQSPLFKGESRQLLPLFEALRQAVDARVPSTTWRSLKRYLAVEANGMTFLAVKRRTGSLLIGLTLPTNVTGPHVGDNIGAFKWARITKLVRISTASQVDADLLSLIEQAHHHATQSRQTKRRFGVSMHELVEAGLLHPGEGLVLATSTRDVAKATLSPSGEIVWDGRVYASPSDRTFASLMGRQSLNGWTSWFVERPTGRQSLAQVRSLFQQAMPRSQSALGVT